MCVYAKDGAAWVHFRPGVRTALAESSMATRSLVLGIAHCIIDRSIIVRPCKFGLPLSILAFSTPAIWRRPGLWVGPRLSCWCTNTSDPGHFGMTEVSRHFGTGAEVSYGHFGTRQSEYLHGRLRPFTLHIMQRPIHEYQRG